MANESLSQLTLLLRLPLLIEVVEMNARKERKNKNNKTTRIFTDNLAPFQISISEILS